MTDERSGPGPTCRGSSSRRARSWRRWWPGSDPSRRRDRVRRGEVDDILTRLTEARRDIDCAAEDLEMLDRRVVAWSLPRTTNGRCWPSPPSTVRPCAKTGRVGADGAVGAGPGATRRDVASDRARSSVPGPRPLRRAPGRGSGGRARRTRRRGRLGRRVRHRRRGPPGDAGADGLTVAVLAGGIDVPYPRTFRTAAPYRRHGLLVTEYPPGVRPARHRFLTRNRLVAALSGATVVIEAGLRSGAANTAAWARGPRPSGLRRARPGDVVGLGGMPRADPERGPW